LLLLPLVLAAGCATRTPPDVGAVVVAPRPALPPLPAIVKATPPKPAGYFQGLLLTYFGDSPEKDRSRPTPTPPAGPTP
jgi:hypothetical protein